MKKKRILYLGLDPSRYRGEGELVHCPLIETEPLPLIEVAAQLLVPHTTLLFTSRVALEYYFTYVPEPNAAHYLTVGKATEERLAAQGILTSQRAPFPTGEGVLELLKTWEGGAILYPHSEQARPLLTAYLTESGKGHSFVLYRTRSRPLSLPDLAAFDTLVFTSPTTVTALRALSPELPEKGHYEVIGPITYRALRNQFPELSPASITFCSEA